ncbi:alpha-ketoglutarate-dependent taurine dioxygenase, putative [Talaromyces stipitatus ATCC 10500]|uniref:Alpha-ketoglutarate-dependent taurine dioxygenase, putative n=1 Tax=Talaromyces stipitatus (strain ATCC 10500 / CBS 375.48 / QM 6759 / NRRL 1006) TaxID=441959 RepID=B8MB57_TALSN|nr:alpha-ketoglutarate-dependent taurine dioxygenase, putative [Talaromyces stipitatus ATCC 10500]EED18846.1 alpha-ketoglutarate-dependent taurine dioxygenase, putative [Talaromyces stipitatus ATCC 10500]
MNVIPIQASCGADIIGFDFEHLYPDQVDAVRAAWRDYGVLRFRGYDITTQQHAKFSNLFGHYVPVKGTSIAHHDQKEITVISNAKVDGKPVGTLGNVDLEWHTDSWYFDKPPCGQILRALELPRTGGDTYWVNMYAVYDALPEFTRKIIEGRLIQFNIVYDAVGRVRPGQEKPETDDFRLWKHVRHPIVRTNPESGRKAVYIGYFDSTKNWIVGLPLEQSKAILEEIYSLIDSGKFVFQQKWQPNDIIMWDNRCTMHRRDGWNETDMRIMHRTGTGTETPIYVY